MNNVKMPRSDSYREYLIESLKEPEESAGYLEAILEEKDAEPELLRNAIRKVIEARIRMNALSDAAKQYHERLDKMLTASYGSEIYCFVKTRKKKFQNQRSNGMLLILKPSSLGHKLLNTVKASR